jgi:16S rRNA processing protein RimM
MPSQSVPLPGPDPSEAAPAWPDDAVEVGRVLGAWGIKGGIKVAAFAADPQALFAATAWLLKPADTPTARTAARLMPAVLQVHGVREQGDAVVAQAVGIVDRDGAEALKGARVFVSRANFPLPDRDEFYWVDLIGAVVVNRDGVTLGEVAGLIETGPHCVLRVRAPASGPAAVSVEGDAALERLVPFVEAYVDSVDVPGRRIVVDWGLDY